MLPLLGVVPPPAAGATGGSPPASVLVSRTPSSIAADGDSTAPAVSPDGRWVAFVSDAPDLVAPAPAAGDHLYVRDLLDGTLRLLDAGQTAPVAPAEVVLAEDARYAAFSALVDPTDPSQGRTVYSLDLASGFVERVDPTPTDVAGHPSISDDGQWIVYTAAPRTSPDARQVRRWHRTDHAVETVSTRDGTDGNGPSYDSAISGDGLVVVFTTEATDLVPGASPSARREPGQGQDVVAWASGAFTLVSATSPDGLVAGSAPSHLAGTRPISTDGSLVAFVSDSPAGEFDPRFVDLNGTSDVIVRNRNDGTTSLRSTAGPAACAGTSGQASLADDGAVTFLSSCPDLVGAASAPGVDVFRSAAPGAEPELLSYTSGTHVATRESGDVASMDAPSVSANGSTSAFRSSAALDPSDGNARDDVWVNVREAPNVQQPTVGVGDRLCPGAAHSVSAAYPGTAPADGTVVLQDAALGVDAGFSRTANDVAIAGGPLQQGMQALVLDVATATGEGATRLTWDFGATLPTRFASRMPPEAAGLQPTRVTVCMPATPNREPRAQAEHIEVAVGQRAFIDVLADDEGYLDPTSLLVTGTSGGTATTGSAGCSGCTTGIVFDAPDAPGPASITYTVRDWFGQTATGIVTVEVAQIAAAWDPLESTCRHASLSIL